RGEAAREDPRRRGTGSLAEPEGRGRGPVHIGVLMCPEMGERGVPEVDSGAALVGAARRGALEGGGRVAELAQVEARDGERLLELVADSLRRSVAEAIEDRESGAAVLDDRAVRIALGRLRRREMVIAERARPVLRTREMVSERLVVLREPIAVELLDG